MKVTDYPKEIERASLDLAATCEELSETREGIRGAEIEALARVIAAKGENDKPLHSNDKARDIAVYFALRSDSSYCQDKATERILEHKKATLEAEIERLRRECRVVLIDYEREQLGRRDAAVENRAGGYSVLLGESKEPSHPSQPFVTPMSCDRLTLNRQSQSVRFSRLLMPERLPGVRLA